MNFGEFSTTFFLRFYREMFSLDDVCCCHRYRQHDPESTYREYQIQHSECAFLSLFGKYYRRYLEWSLEVRPEIKNQVRTLANVVLNQPSSRCNARSVGSGSVSRYRSHNYTTTHICSIYGAQAGFQAIGSRDRTGSIVGGVVGGIVLVASVILVYVFWRRRARIQKDGTETETGDILYSRAVPYEYRNLEQIDEDGRPATLESSRSHGTPQGTNATPRVIPSSKERVAPTQSGTPPNLTAPSSPGLEGTAVFVPAVGRVSGGPTPDYTGLRSEVDNLRRVVRELQTERLDAPPNYQDIHNQSAPRTPQAVPQSADPEANGSGDGKPFWRRRASL